jgi:uncharacterized protein (DUF488 family)
MSTNTIYTIGHSTKSFEDFVMMLLSFKIKMLVDIRSYPGSRWFPHFNKERMRSELAKLDIDYIHLKDLGGRREVESPSVKRGKKPAVFSGYKAYMQTDAYKVALEELEKSAREKATAYMCAEADWRKCHRSLVSDSLSQHGWTVVHILGVQKREVHLQTKIEEHQQPVSIKEASEKFRRL